MHEREDEDVEGEVEGEGAGEGAGRESRAWWKKAFTSIESVPESQPSEESYAALVAA